MPRTLVLQSYRTPIEEPWISACLSSVKSWASSQQYDYQFIDDDLFSLVPAWVMDKTREQKVIATDIARLLWLQKYLKQDYDAVIWMDADFLIFNPKSFSLSNSFSTQETYLLGEEIWVQARADNPKKLKAYKNVHNAFMAFHQSNTFLDFYADHALQLLEKNTGTMPPQFIGPKLLTALSNIVQCPLLPSAAMFSPLVIENIIAGGGCALQLLKKTSKAQPAAANLCRSMTEKKRLSSDQMQQACDQLLGNPALWD